MKSFLLFFVATIGMCSLVPLSVLAATRSWHRTWEAMRGYAICLGLVLGIPMAVGMVVGLVLNLF